MPELTSAGLAALQRAIGHDFEDLDLLREALIHTSWVNERADRGLRSNERLEFLGDAVLGVIVAHCLYEARPDASEGELTVLRAWLVRQSTLARWARQREIGQYIMLGRGEARGGGRERPAILARTFEAILGAVYLDGGLEAADDVVLPLIEEELRSGFTPQKAVDAKSRLQQVSQGSFGSMPEYTLLEATGPGHAPHFVFEVRVGPRLVARGEGFSKRSAQQAAAHAALQQLEAEAAEIGMASG